MHDCELLVLLRNKRETVRVMMKADGNKIMNRNRQALYIHIIVTSCHAKLLKWNGQPKSEEKNHAVLRA